MNTNIDAIRQLLISDMFRLKAAEREAEDLQEAIDRWSQVKGESDMVEYRADLRTQREIADEARQSFAARTEMLQHIDLGDTTADELVASAGVASGGGGGVYGPGGSPAAGADPDPDATRALRTASSVATAPVAAEGPGKTARTIDQDVRDFLNTHHR